ncbi:hypothetical protein [uncultured Massilia sp.]|uniref:DUF6968 family protein n=1 Tax=uncultured Massilia sp. TaxID=169973 RepID=UPI0025893C1F|nr:hypothetical protein [uncultured Massilia sp.]
MKSPLDKPIAQQSFLWIRPDGGEVAVTAKIGAPYCEDGTLWRCPAALEGIDMQYPDIFGEGSMQALGLAMRLIRTRLMATIEGSGTLYYMEDRSTPVTTDLINTVFAG